MAWTSPMTAVSGAVFTASQYNTYVRDNMLEMGVSKVMESGDYFASHGTNQIVKRRVVRDFVSSSGTRDSGVYGDLSTPGPTVTVETGATAMIAFASYMDSSTANGVCRYTYEVSGATTLAADDIRELTRDGHAANCPVRWGAFHIRNDLNPGTNTFTMKYRGTTTTYQDRELIVIPF